MKEKGFFRKISFVLIMSLVCTLMPLGYGHEEVQAATAGANAFARLSAYVADDGLYILSKSFFTTYSSHSAWAAYYYQDSSGYKRNEHNAHKFKIRNIKSGVQKQVLRIALPENNICIETEKKLEE